MKYGNYGVIDLSIYDEFGHFVTKLDTLKHSELVLKSDNPSINVQDSLIDSDLLAFLGKEECKELSDFEIDLQHNSHQRTIVFSKLSTKKCKLIGKGFMRKCDDQQDVEFTFVADNSVIDAGVNLRFHNGGATKVDLVFKLEPSMQDGILVKMHIQEEDPVTQFAGAIQKSYELAKQFEETTQKLNPVSVNISF